MPKLLSHLLFCTLLLGPAHRASAQVLPDDLRFEPVVSGLDQPLGVRHAGDNRLFVIQQGGQLRIMENGVLLAEPFLDFDVTEGGTAPPLGFTTGGERGLLGLAFHPDYATNGFFFVYYTDGAGDTVVARFRRSNGNPDRADFGSGEVVLRVDQDFGNHNGGDLHFGPDGYLYIGLGDGGSGNDPCNRGQTLDPANLDNGGSCAADGAFTGNGGDPDSRALLGKMLRIEAPVNPRTRQANGTCGGGGTDLNYSVPGGNPYAGGSGACAEVFASGLRNPYRFSVDRENGDLWIGDVGQNSREEISRVPAGLGGLNFGWRCREGFIANGAVSCSDTPFFTDPVIDHPRTEARSITGGFRYRGPIRSLHGVVFYGDFVTGRQFALQRVGEQWLGRTWRDSGGAPAGYGEDLAGNLYLADYGGTIFRLEATDGVIFTSGMEIGE
ncbi:MAG: PQQ-dependent sugar dehydrogenase [Xanthomonadales bacterium]|jgi:glucose/arabinose dehydrogenase|nr:PQQ-dependent sugar dehydrogenase [Xanthomonadales bacterium]